MTIVHRRDELRASKIMRKRAEDDEEIHFAWNSEVSATLGENRVESLMLRDTVTREECAVPADRTAERTHTT